LSYLHAVMPSRPSRQSRRRSGIRIFYAPPPLDGEDLALHGVGVREWMRPGAIDRPGGTGDWLLMAFHQGMRFGDRVTDGPCLVVWSPRHGHRYGHDQGEWCHSWIHCAGLAVARLVAASGLPLDRPIAPIDMAGIERCLDGIHREAQARPSTDAVIVENLLHILLRATARASRATGPEVPPAFLAARGHIDAVFTEPLALADLARRAGCSVGHFCAGFKRWFGVSAIDYAIGLRMQRARILLGDRNLTVHAVARAVGYEDLHHFSKLFRKRHGRTPGSLRS